MLTIAIGFWLLLVSMLVVLAVGRRVCRPAFWTAVQRKRNPIGVMFGAFHALIIGYLAYVVLTTADRLWPAIWLYAAVLDFPVSLLHWILDIIIIPPTIIDLVANPTSRLNNLNNFWIPFVFFLTVGTAWWFTLPRVIIGRNREVERRRDSKQTEQSALPPFGR